MHQKLNPTTPIHLISNFKPSSTQMATLKESTNKTCIGCKQVMPSRNDLYKHYYVCESYLDIFRGSTYEINTREAYKRMNGDVDKLITTCIGCFTCFPDSESFFTHYTSCNKAKKIIKKPADKELYKNNVLKTCQECGANCNTRNELRRHYMICDKNHELYKGTAYYTQIKAHLAYCKHNPSRIHQTCPGCQKTFHGFNELSNHRHVCSAWIQPGQEKQTQNKPGKKEKPIQIRSPIQEQTIQEKTIQEKTIQEQTIKEQKKEKGRRQQKEKEKPQNKQTIPQDIPVIQEKPILQEKSTHQEDVSKQPYSIIPVDIPEHFIKHNNMTYYVPAQKASIAAFPAVHATL